jgi:hypothetical protein
MILTIFGRTPRSFPTPVAAYLLPDGTDPDPRDHTLLRQLASCSLPEPRPADLQAFSSPLVTSW